MSRLEELIREYCPDGVEYKKLSEVASVERGGSFQKKDYVPTGVPCVHYGQIYVHYNLYISETLTYISETTAKNQKYAEPNDIIMAVTSENVEDVCKSIAWLGNKKVAVSGHAAIIHHTLNAKYLSYYFNSSLFFQQKVKLAHGTKVIEVTPSALNDVIIPVPPLPVQEEIVRILDSFTQLTAELQAELQAELTARQKQYEYYRDLLLTFGDVSATITGQTDRQTRLTAYCRAVKWLSLGEIANIVRGASPRPIKNYITDSINGVNWIKIGDVSPGTKYITKCAEKITQEGALKSREVRSGDFILSNSMSFGRPYILKIDGCIHDGWLSISNFDEFVTADYLYHVLTSSAIQYMMKQKASFGGAVQNLNADIVRSIVIPVPDIDEQNRIVQVLDRFSILCTDITSGLPAEIEARRKQYEYYRDRLLSFPRKEN